MTKIALITDLHWGARGDSKPFLEYFSRFYSEVFFPYLDEHNIKTVICLGDTYDKRKGIQFNTLKTSKTYLFDQLKKRDITFHAIVGNHDMFSRSSSEVNSAELLVMDDIKSHYVYSGLPQKITIDDLDILMVPWIIPQDHEVAMEMIRSTSASIIMGHFEIDGFELHSGSPLSSGGLPQDTFRSFDTVLSGHYHKKSTKSNIMYLGTPYEITWADYKDPKGFHVLDTTTREIEFIRNPILMFHKFFYNDTTTSLKDMETSLEKVLPQYTNSYVKVIVSGRDNLYTFDRIIDMIQKSNPANIQVVEDHHNVQLQSEADIISSAEDTLTTINKAVDELAETINKDAVKEVMANLYVEALAKMEE
jgi:DNA repair exonuclease SbcCD nuclease subunit